MELSIVTPELVTPVQATTTKWNSDEGEMRRWCTILSKPPSLMPTPLYEILSNYFDIVNYDPIYQRGRFRHDETFVCELLESIMLYGFVQPVLLYKLQPGDECKDMNHKWEVVDGVHRLKAISCFMKGEYIYAEKNRKIMPYIFHKESNTYLFYKKTESTESWRNLPENKRNSVKYFTPAECYRFDNYELFIQRIMSPLTMDERRKEFTKIQITKTVKNNDFYKNRTDLLAIKNIVDNNLDYYFKNICDNHLDKDIQQYSTVWILRFWLMSIGYNTPEKCMEIKDTEIKRRLEKDNSLFINCSPQHGELFIKQIENFAKFFHDLDDKIKFSPCALYAIFVRVLMDNIDKNEIIILQSHMRHLSESETKEERRIWEPKRSNEIVSYFSNFLNKLRDIKDVCPNREIKEPRKKIPEKIRNAVWKLNFNNDDIGDCFACKKEIFKKASDRLKTWNCGHIVSDHDNGEMTAENMKPICFDCNQRMKTANLFEWKQKFYPENI